MAQTLLVTAKSYCAILPVAKSLGYLKDSVTLLYSYLYTWVAYNSVNSNLQTLAPYFHSSSSLLLLLSYLPQRDACLFHDCRVVL